MQNPHHLLLHFLSNQSECKATNSLKNIGLKNYKPLFLDSQKRRKTLSIPKMQRKIRTCSYKEKIKKKRKGLNKNLNLFYNWQAETFWQFPPRHEADDCTSRPTKKMPRKQPKHSGPNHFPHFPTGFPVSKQSPRVKKRRRKRNPSPPDSTSPKK